MLLSIHQTSFRPGGVLLLPPLLLLLLVELSTTGQTFAATIPLAAVKDMFLNLRPASTWGRGVEDLVAAAEEQMKKEDESLLTYPPDVDSGQPELQEEVEQQQQQEGDPLSGPSPGAINRRRTKGHYNDVGGAVDDDDAIRSRSGGDNKVDEETPTAGDYQELLSVNYEEAINRRGDETIEEEEYDQDEDLG